MLRQAPHLNRTTRLPYSRAARPTHPTPPTHPPAEHTSADQPHPHPIETPAPPAHPPHDPTIGNPPHSHATESPAPPAHSPDQRTSADQPHPHPIETPAPPAHSPDEPTIGNPPRPHPAESPAPHPTPPAHSPDEHNPGNDRPRSYTTGTPAPPAHSPDEPTPGNPPAQPHGPPPRVTPPSSPPCPTGDRKPRTTPPAGAATVRDARPAPDPNGRPARAGVPAPVPAPPAITGAPSPDALFVGRGAELHRLAATAESVAARRRLRPALISGEAGAGKTALAQALTRHLAERGWTTAWGRSAEYADAPAAWPWIEIGTELAEAGHPFGPSHTEAGHPPHPSRAETGRPFDPRAADPDSDRSPTDPAAARFHRYLALVAHLSEVAAHGPLLLVLDDLHWAGEQTLAALTALTAHPLDRPVLVLGTYRDTEVSTALAHALGRIARAEPIRVELAGLPEPHVRELVRAAAGRDVDDPTARAIHRRTAGNPFFVRELARLLADSDAPADALADVPVGVRDVIRHRLAGLPEASRAVLRHAAVLGLDVDLDLLIALTGDEEATLDAVEFALPAGFLLDAGPDRVRFAHALVRDTLYADLPRARRARRHAAAAHALERLRPEDVDALAHHFVRAEGRVPAERTAYYARAAAERAERRFAPHEAARWWRAAVDAWDHASAEAGSTADRLRARLDAVMGLVRALAFAGELGAARRHRDQAVAAAEELGDAPRTARVIGAFDVPAIWPRTDDPESARRIVVATERTLAALPPDADEARGRLLSTLALELRGATGDRGRDAAREAEAIARRVDDPALLAFALDGRFLHTFERAGLAAQRAAIGAELLDLAHRRQLPAFEVLAHLILLQAHTARADFAAADRHAASVDHIAERYELPLVSVFTDGYAALRLTVANRPGAAAAYRKLAARLPGTGMHGMADGFLPFTLACLRVQADRPVEPTPEVAPGPDTPWIRPLELLAAGRRDAAAEAFRRLPESPRDLLLEARLCLAARAAVALDDRPAMALIHAALLPAAAELAGAGSGLLTLGPVARHLGDLCAATGRPAEAREHYRRALDLAHHVAAPHWITAIRAALTESGDDRIGPATRADPEP
ncbi:ATP-binding protein [Embleya sp. NPDC050154]|uniref:ATP-binding protein n=1 Tax=Embleya sp. NPDC050154 TaxID=3363988 RepID=UPI00379A54E5